jgi:hypothetical protein
MRYGLMILAMTAAAAGPAVAQTPPAPPPTAPMALQAQAAWLKVRQALTPSQQAFEVRAFVAAATTERGRRPEWAIDARDLASGRAVPLDDPALLQRPQALEITLTLDGRFYTFRPLSRASLEPLLAP